MKLVDYLGLVLSPVYPPACGDMIVRGPSGGFTTIPVGKPGQVLAVHPETGLPAWVDLKVLLKDQQPK